MKTKKQILFIHGGETFKRRKDYINFLKTTEVSIKRRKSWSTEYLDEKLGKDFEIIRPRMPQSFNAIYEDWQIWFEKYIPFLKQNIILLGNSLGGMFLAKYLSENTFPKKILSVYMVCSPFDNTCPNYDLVNRFKLKSDLSLIEKNCKDVTLMFSDDDDVVPVEHAEKYRKKLKNSKIIIYKNKNGHFGISKFPEIIKMIKEDIK